MVDFEPSFGGFYRCDGCSYSVFVPVSGSRGDYYFAVAPVDEVGRIRYPDASCAEAYGSVESCVSAVDFPGEEDSVFVAGFGNDCYSFVVYVVGCFCDCDSRAAGADRCVYDIACAFDDCYSRVLDAFCFVGCEWSFPCGGHDGFGVDCEMEAVFASCQSKEGVAVLAFDSKQQVYAVGCFYRCAVEDGVCAERKVVDGDCGIAFPSTQEIETFVLLFSHGPTSVDLMQFSIMSCTDVAAMHIQLSAAP